MTPEQIIKRPIALTEKAMQIKLGHNQVVFEVDPRANKIQIRHAVETLFDVKVTSVNTLVQRGKRRRVGRREVSRPNWKKAMVTLSPEDDIQFFDEATESAEE
jgi:large subunit ribosomal protein L23